MDRFTQDKLNLTPRSEAELRSVVNHLELKWQQKARRQFGNDHMVQF
jgi:hypothetical protein